MDRRDFLKTAGATICVTAGRRLAGATRGPSIIVDPEDAIAAAPPSIWAVRELQSAFGSHGSTAHVYPRIEAAPAGNPYIIVAGGDGPIARQILTGARATMASSAETL